MLLESPCFAPKQTRNTQYSSKRRRGGDRQQGRRAKPCAIVLAFNSSADERGRAKHPFQKRNGKQATTKIKLPSRIRRTEQ